MNIIIKPWGYEEILETNEQYTVKRITMNAGHRCSLQKHIEKKETFVLLKGVMQLTHNDVERALQDGDSFTIEPGEVHRMAAVTNIVYLECSTSQLDDVVRIADLYGRTEQ
jgi:mannose-6-phosphate isomerase